MPQLLPGVSSGVSSIVGEETVSECAKDVHRSIEKNDGILTRDKSLGLVHLSIELQANLQLTNRFVGRF